MLHKNDTDAVESRSRDLKRRKKITVPIVFLGSKLVSAWKWGGKKKVSKDRYNIYNIGNSHWIATWNFKELLNTPQHKRCRGPSKCTCLMHDQWGTTKTQTAKWYMVHCWICLFVPGPSLHFPFRHRVRLFWFHSFSGLLFLNFLICTSDWKAVSAWWHGSHRQFLWKRNDNKHRKSDVSYVVMFSLCLFCVPSLLTCAWVLVEVFHYANAQSHPVAISLIQTRPGSNAALFCCMTHDAQGLRIWIRIVPARQQHFWFRFPAQSRLNRTDARHNFQGLLETCRSTTIVRIESSFWVFGNSPTCHTRSWTPNEKFVCAMWVVRAIVGADERWREARQGKKIGFVKHHCLTCKVWFDKNVSAFGKNWMHFWQTCWKPLGSHPPCQTLLAAATIGALAGGCPSEPMAVATCRGFQHAISRGHSGCWSTCCIEKEQVQESGAANWKFMICQWIRHNFKTLCHKRVAWAPTVEPNQTGGIPEGRAGIAAQPPESANRSCKGLRADCILTQKQFDNHFRFFRFVLSWGLGPRRWGEGAKSTTQMCAEFRISHDFPYIEVLEILYRFV